MTQNLPGAAPTPRSRSRRFRLAPVALLTALAVLLPVGLEAGTGSATAQAAAGTRITRDVIVYGGTPAGVAAAVAAADRGARVTLLAEGRTVGGLMSNGISASDIGAEAAVQGLAKEFFRRIRAYYRDSDTWRFEPRIAERVLVRMLAQNGVKVRYNAPVTRVVKKGRAITCVVVPSDRSYCGEAFIDASYTGDLLAGAGAPHRLGYGDLLSYGESLAAKRKWYTYAQAPDGTTWAGNPFIRTASSLPPFSSAYKAGMPSLTYRLCVTTKSANKTPFRKPAAYDEYLPTFRAYAKKLGGTVTRNRLGTLHSGAFQLARLPGGKYDLNSGYKSFTNVPAPADYFTSRATRLQWNRVLRGYVESFFYFIGHDASVPDGIRTTFDGFGLCKDEFTDNGNWPREPYVREARRIDGQYTITVKDVYTNRTKSDAIAVGSYNVDGKLSQLLAVGGTVYRDLSVHARAPVYEIPFRAIQPKAASNLLVPVGVSSSPTAYGTIRMEPQYMAMGQAAGIAAALAAKHDRSTRFLPASWVQKGLRVAGAEYKALDVCRAGDRSWRRHGGFDAGCTVVRKVDPQVG
jgi:hypothetical protein